MIGANDLERAVLAAIAAQNPHLQRALEAQFAASTVINRENSGAGFFTHFRVDRANAPAVLSEKTLGDVEADIVGLPEPMTFLMFIERGYAVMLEGTALDGDTSELDFDAAVFSLLRR